MKEYGGREAAQSSASRRCLPTGFCFFFGALIPTHSLVALLSIWAFSLSSQLRPAAGLFVSRSSGTRSLSPRDLSSICPPHVHPNFTSSASSSSSLNSFTTSFPPAASIRADVFPRSHRMYPVETASGVSCPVAILQRSAIFSTLTTHSAAADRGRSSFPLGAAIPSRATVAAAPPPLRRRAAAVIGAGRPTIAATGVAAAAPSSSSGNRAAEASASCNPPSSAPAPAAAHSSACECFDTGARTTSSPLAEAASACSAATSPTTGASTCAAVGPWKLRRQECCCFLHGASQIKRRPPSRQHSQRLGCDLSSSLSLCSSPAWWAPQRRQPQQPRWQALAASLSFGSRTSGERGEKAGQEGGRKRSSSNTSGGSFAAASAARAASASAASRRETRAGTALFDSQEERFSALKSLKEQETPKFQAEGWTEEMPLLEVKDLHVVAVEDGQEILKGVNLTVMPGEVHAIMGRNGSGKSTLSKVLAGYPSYKVTGGSVRYKGLDLLELAIDNRGLAGLFLAFQYPIEIPMVSNLEFLRVAFNERRKWKGEEEVDSIEFRHFVEGKLQEVGLNPSFLSRPLNYGFSGGEKKRNEILQMIVLDPELVMLDETDSGLDVDSFNVTAAAIKRFGMMCYYAAARKNKSFLVTTHYKKLLDVLLPHKIHVMHAGRVILSGDLSLASRIEKEGFASLISDDPREEEEEKRGLARGENLLEDDEAYEAPPLSPSAAGGGRRDLDKLL